MTTSLAWMPHVLYWKSLDKKLHKLLLLRGGKFVRIWTQNPMGDRFYSWANNSEMHLLTEDQEDFADPVDDEDFLKKSGQLKYEVHVQLDNYTDHAIMVQDQVVSFMKEVNNQNNLKKRISSSLDLFLMRALFTSLRSLKWL